MQVRVRSSSSVWYVCVYVYMVCVCVCVQTASGRPAGLTWKATSLRSSDRNVATHVNAIISSPSPFSARFFGAPGSCNCLLFLPTAPCPLALLLQQPSLCAAPYSTTQRSRSLIVYEELCNVCLACSRSLSLPSNFSHLLLLLHPSPHPSLATCWLISLASPAAHTQTTSADIDNCRSGPQGRWPSWSKLGCFTLSKCSTPASCLPPQAAAVASRSGSCSCSVPPARVSHTSVTYHIHCLQLLHASACSPTVCLSVCHMLAVCLTVCLVACLSPLMSVCLPYACCL